MKAPFWRASERYCPLKWAPLTMKRVRTRPDVLGVAGDQRHGGGEEGGREGLSAGEEPLPLEELPVVAQGADGKIHMCHLMKDYRRRVFSVVTVSMPLPAEK